MHDIAGRQRAALRGHRRVKRGVPLWVCNRSGDALWVAVPGPGEGTQVRQALVAHDALALARLRPPLIVHARRLGDPDLRPNGCYLSWDLHHEPPLLQLRTFHYKVEPGSAGRHPGRQPLLLGQQSFELQLGPHALDVDRNFRARLVPCSAEGPASRRP